MISKVNVKGMLFSFLIVYDNDRLILMHGSMRKLVPCVEEPHDAS